MKIPEKFKTDSYYDYFDEDGTQYWTEYRDLLNSVNSIIDVLEEQNEKIDELEKRVSGHDLFLPNSNVQEYAITTSDKTEYNQSAPEQNREGSFPIKLNLKESKRPYLNPKAFEDDYNTAVDNSDKIELFVEFVNVLIKTINHIGYSVLIKPVNTATEAEAVKEKIDRAIEFYEKYKEADIESILAESARVRKRIYELEERQAQDTDVRLNNDVSLGSDDKLDLDWEKEFGEMPMYYSQEYDACLLKSEIKSRISKWIQQAREEAMPFSKEELVEFSSWGHFERLTLKEYKRIFTDNELLAKLDKMIKNMEEEGK